MNILPTNQEIREDVSFEGQEKNEPFNDILSIKERCNPANSPAVDAFLTALFDDNKEECLRVLTETNILLIDTQIAQEQGDELKIKMHEHYRPMVMNLREERDTYAQFYFSVMDMVASTPALMELSHTTLDSITLTIKEVIKNPKKKIGEMSLIMDIVWSLVKVIKSKANRDALGTYLKRVDFKKPFLYMIQNGNIPDNLYTLAPKIEALNQLEEQYQEIKANQNQK